MIYFNLFFQFFKIGLFSFGGAYATIPFLYNLSDTTGWFTHGDIFNMLAISQSLPGPIGINIATFSGYKVAGFAGGLIACLGLTLPSLILVGIAFGFLRKFSQSPVIKAILWGLRPAATAMIAYALIIIGKSAIFNFPKFHSSGNIFDIFKIQAFLILFILLILNKKLKPHPFLIVITAGLLGAVSNL